MAEPYRSRAVPPGTHRYWSWLFAAPVARGPLVGVYALAAEWRGLTDPRTEASVAQIKLAWWRDEIQRLAAGTPLHPITRFIATLPGAGTADFAELQSTLAAGAAAVGGVPLAHAAELDAHADALYGIPLRAAAALAGQRDDRAALRKSTAALAVGLYLTRAIGTYRREARVGRIPFAVDELLAAGIVNDDLVAVGAAPPPLDDYLQRLRQQAAAHFSTAAAALAPDERRTLRHLAVLGALGRRHVLCRKYRAGADFRLADLYNAWNAARRAAAAH